MALDRNKVIEFAKNYIGVKEDPPKSNRGPKIDIIQKEFGLQGEQYCVMFAVYCILKSNPGILLTKKANSQDLYQWAESKNYAYTDPAQIKPGDIVIWRKYREFKGHAGLVYTAYNQEKSSFETIEGNTSNSDFGSQREGDGIYRRIRKAAKEDWAVDDFYLRGFIDISKIPFKAAR